MSANAGTTYLRNSYGMLNHRRDSSDIPLLMSSRWTQNDAQTDDDVFRPLPNAVAEAVDIGNGFYTAGEMVLIDLQQYYTMQCHRLDVKKPNSHVHHLFERLNGQISDATRCERTPGKYFVWDEGGKPCKIPLLELTLGRNYCGSSAGFAAFCATLDYCLNTYIPKGRQNHRSTPHYGLSLDLEDNFLSTENIRRLADILLMQRRHERSFYVIASLRVGGNGVDHLAGAALLRLAKFNPNVLELQIYNDSERAADHTAHSKLLLQIDLQCLINGKRFTQYFVSNM